MAIVSAPARSPTLTLNTGAEMPQLGLGVWQATDGDETRAVEAALELGYRHIDTAAAYKNEAGVGRGIAKAGLPREELFVTTKVFNDRIRAREARDSALGSLERLGLDYVDLLLLHWPVDGGLEAWRALERLHDDGLARAIGVSNYMPEHLDELLAATDVVPANNQIEFHPYCQQADVVDYCRERGIAVTAWSPLMQGHFTDEPALAEIGARHGKTPAQVLLRWDVQRGVATIPKSTHRGRIAQNIDVFDFALTEAEVALLDGLTRPDGRFGPDPRDFNF